MSFPERFARITGIMQENLFRAWLESAQNEQIVGLAGAARKCPLAEYIRSHGYLIVEVSGEFITAGLTIIDTPPWAACFIEQVDLHDGPIMKMQALQFLKDAPVRL